MRITIQLVENNLAQEIPSIILTIQNQKYIFNMPQTFQRFTKEHRFKFPKASNIFFTKVNASSVAGLKGFMLTLYQTSNAWDTKIFSNSQLFNYLNQVRYQMGFKILPYSYYDWSGLCQRGFRNNDLVAELLKRKDYPTQFHNIDKYIDQIDNKQLNINDCKRSIKDGVFKDQNIQIIPFHIESNQEKFLSNFICIPNKIQGKVLPQKIKQFNIPKKLINKLLKQGEIELEGGKIIYSKDIKQQDVSSPNFIIMHITQKQTLMKAIKHQILQKYVSDKNNITQGIIYIIENPQIVQTIQFKQFLNLFKGSVSHILFTKNYKDKQLTQMPILFKHYHIVSKIATYFPQNVSNLIQIQQKNWMDYLAKCKNIQQIFPQHNIEIYKRYYQMILAPVKSRGYMKLAVEQKKQMDLQLDIQELKFIKNNLYKKQNLWNFSKLDPLVVFLGTGSMKPSAYRNVSGIYVELDHQTSAILDCGEGTYYQLLNHFGMQKFDKILLSIKIIFITHIHSDHNLGILNLIAQKNKLCKKLNIKSQTFLLVPCNMAPWINAFDEYIQSLNIKCLFIQTLVKGKYDYYGTFSKDQKYNPNCYKAPDTVQQTQYYSTPKLEYIIQNKYKNQNHLLEEFQNFLKSIKITKFKPVDVIHCPQSYGIIIQYASGIKISYSGDTRPCPNFIKEAQNSTLMIHEATFGDDLQKNAVQNLHSTVKQALQSGLKSNSWRIALTHFSQRYKNNSQILQTHTYKHDPQLFQYSNQNAIVCFDHFHMRLSDGQNMPKITKLIMRLLPEDQQ